MTDLSMSAALSSTTLTIPDEQDACGLCGYWTCRCTRQTAPRMVAAGIIRRTGRRTVRITATAAGITGSIRPAVAR